MKSVDFLKKKQLMFLTKFYCQIYIIQVLNMKNKKLFNFKKKQNMLPKKVRFMGKLLLLMKVLLLNLQTIIDLKGEDFNGVLPSYYKSKKRNNGILEKSQKFTQEDII